MAKRDSVYRPDDAESAVVIGSSIYDVPLLPYERQLIATIGITEEEYRAFTAEVRRRGAVRPAAYENIPDIQNIAGPVTGAAIAATYLGGGAAAKSATTVVLTNLAIGLTLTGISYLLTPKPKMPRAQGGGLKDLGSITGANRFTPSRGFETLAELADYASPVPIIFGMYKTVQLSDGTENDIGGILVTPKLIWSRMFSHGTSQRAKLMFVVGEQGVNNIGIDKPELEGIFLGNNALDAIFEDNFAFYWHKASFSSNFRIKGDDIQYGTRKSLDSGDPEIKKSDDVFDVEDAGDFEANQLFCHAYTPSNSAAFGCHSPIANGTNFRVNYQLNLIAEDSDQDQKKVIVLQRMKVMGESGAIDGSSPNGKNLRDREIIPRNAAKDERNRIIEKLHDGTGRNYSPRMGIIEYTVDATKETIKNNDTINTLFIDKTFKTVISNVAKNDEIVFSIKNSRISEDFYQRDEGGAPVDDINSTVVSLQEEADGAMQLGEHFMIGGSIWKVTHRRLKNFEPSTEKGKDQRITLRCVDTSTSRFKKIGIVSKDLVVEPQGVGNEFIGDSGVGDQSINVGEGFFPLTQVAIATIKNNRPAYITEIGLKSTVFQRLNGLCNFQNLPSTGEVKNSEKENIQINNGTISATIRRSSMFRIYVRDARDNGSTFEPFPQIFVIQGQSPSAQYNYIKFINQDQQQRSEQLQRQLEFKFVPFPCSEFRAIADTDTSFTFVVLDQSASTANAADSNLVQLGPVTLSNGLKIEIKVSGRTFDDKTGLKGNNEFKKAPKTIAAVEEPTYPDAAAFDTPSPFAAIGNIAEVGENLGRPSAGRNIADVGINKGKQSAFFYAIAGSADNSNVRKNRYITVETFEYINGKQGKWLHLRWKIRKKENDTASYSGERFRWAFDDSDGSSRVTVLGSGGGFSAGETIEIKRGSEGTDVTSGQSNYPNTNPFANNHPDGTMTFSGMRFVVNTITKDVELAARSQAWRYEVFGAIGNLKTGKTKTVSGFVFNKDSKKITVDLKATVIDFKAPIVGQRQGWTDGKVTKIYEGTDTSTGEWEVDEIFSDFRAVSSNNPFFTLYSAVGQNYKIGSVKTERTTDPIASSELDFASQSQVSDISAYRNFVEKSNNTAPEHEIVYINEVQINDNVANMFNLTLAGFSLKAGRNFTALDQMRVWLKNGIPVERLHPTVKTPGSFYGDTAEFGPSNLLTDLMYFMFTDQTAGAGGLLGMDGSRSYMVERSDLVLTSKFLVKNNLFFNGPIVERTNLRQFFSDIAPSFLCNFSIVNGKFSLKPAFPVKSDGTISIDSIDPEAFFTAGNILEDSYKIEYLGAEERRSFKAVVRYRQERANQLPEEAVVEVKGIDETGIYSSPGTSLLPQEEFDLTQFCTSRDHAVLVAKYFLALRAYVTHTINFSTTAEGLNIGAGSFIKVTTEATPYNSANTGTVDATGVITSVRDMPDNLKGYPITYFKSGDGEIETGTLIVSNGTVEDAKYHNILFTVTASEVSQNIYVVEQLTFTQDGIVDIVASEHPCNSEQQSKIALAALRSDDDGWSVQS